MKNPKILLFDIETSPNIGLTWGRYEQDVLRFVKHRELLSVAWHWLGTPGIHCKTRQGKKDDEQLSRIVRGLLNQADIVIAHNGRKFDVKVSKARIIKHGLPPVQVLTQVDTLDVAKAHFDFNGNKLDDLTDFLGIGHKIPHPGLSMWEGCMNGDAKSWKLMEKYNKHDVYLLTELYKRLRPWIHNHPSVARILRPEAKPGECPACGSKDTCKNGFRSVQSTLQQRWVCKPCGLPFCTRRGR